MFDENVFIGIMIFGSIGLGILWAELYYLYNVFKDKIKISKILFIALSILMILSLAELIIKYG